MRKTIVTLSFDDGREDTYRNAYMIMKKYNLVGTIHVTTGYVDASYTNCAWKSAKGAVSVQELLEMKNAGFEISSHGDKHISEKEDFEISRRKLQQWGLVNEDLGFSIPNSDLSGKEKAEFIKFAKTNDIRYIRGGRDKRSHSLFSKICFLLYRFLSIQYFYNRFNKFNSIDLQDTLLNKYELPSVVVRREDNPRMIINYIREKANRGKWIILMLHSIKHESENPEQDVWCWDTNKFEMLCSKLRELQDEREIEIKTILETLCQKQLVNKLNYD